MCHTVHVKQRHAVLRGSSYQELAVKRDIYIGKEVVDVAFSQEQQPFGSSYVLPV
jgi:hypothetical protein